MVPAPGGDRCRSGEVPLARVRAGRHRLAGDGGLTSVEFVVAAALSLLFTAGLLDVAIVQYATGAVHSALEAGARAGSRVGSGEVECEQAAARWLADVLGGTRGESVAIACTVEPTVVRASASAGWDAWLPGVPRWEVRVEAVRAREVVP